MHSLSTAERGKLHFPSQSVEDQIHTGDAHYSRRLPGPSHQHPGLRRCCGPPYPFMPRQIHPRPAASLSLHPLPPAAVTDPASRRTTRFPSPLHCNPTTNVCFPRKSRMATLTGGHNLRRQHESRQKLPGNLNVSTDFQSLLDHAFHRLRPGSAAPSSGIVGQMSLKWTQTPNVC